jgi:IclR family transcriptional regulator, acetate operon repressor
MSTTSEPQDDTSRTSGGLQTVHRALDVLEIVAELGNRASLATIADRAGLTRPTTHRLCRTLVERGYMRQLSDRSYALGLQLVPLGNAANALVGVDAHAVLADLVAELGETANLAMLAGTQAEYVAQVPSRYQMRMFTEVGRRVALHSTGVGKAILAQLAPSTVRAIVHGSGLQAQTPFTISTEVALDAELQRIREQGYAMDEQEQEVGVRCVAVALAPRSLPGMALSISGPLTRMTDDVIARAVPLLRSGADRLTAELDAGGRS